LSCRKFRDSEVRLQLHAIAYNLATTLRGLDLPEAMTSLQLKLIQRLAGDACITEKEDRGMFRPPRPRHHVPTGPGGCHWPDGAHHSRRHPPIASAKAFCLTAIRTQTKRSGGEVGPSFCTAP
jgi:hypothetical protein